MEHELYKLLVEKTQAGKLTWVEVVHDYSTTNYETDLIIDNQKHKIVVHVSFIDVDGQFSFGDGRSTFPLYHLIEQQLNKLVTQNHSDIIKSFIEKSKEL